MGTVSKRVPRIFETSVRERKANLWVAEHYLENFCSLWRSLSPRFFPANDGHMHIYETIIYLWFLPASLLLCSELPWQSYPKSVLREDESSLLSVPMNMKIGGVQTSLTFSLSSEQKK